MSSRAVNIINALYGREMRSWRNRIRDLPGRVRARVDARRRKMNILSLYRERNRILTRGRIIVAIVICLVAALFTASIVYFNTLTRLEQDVFKEQAKIDSLLQRRRNISINLARTVRDYAVHEQEIFHHVSDVRAATPQASRSGKGEGVDMESPLEEALKSEAPAGSPQSGKAPEVDPLFDEVLSMLEGSSSANVPFEKKLSGLVAVAESYPDLKLSDNFRRFMEALVETEKELSYRRMEYSDVVNTYTTQLKTYPGKLFAFMYGFEPVPYFVADTEAGVFRPVEY